jgi:hypothetical protein
MSEVLSRNKSGPTSRQDVGSSIRFEQDVAANFAQRLLDPISCFIGGRLIEIRQRLVCFNGNADEQSIGSFAASAQGG